MRLLFVLVMSLVVINAADARTRHHKRHVKPAHVVITCDLRGCSDGMQRAQPVKSTRELSTRRHQFAERSEEAAAQGVGSDLIGRARRYLGMTAGQIGLHRRTQWCAAFLRHLGVRGVDDRAISFKRLPRTSAQVGAIAVFPHHVGIVTGFDHGYPILLSGNSNGRRVYEGTYPRHPLAYVSPG